MTARGVTIGTLALLLSMLFPAHAQDQHRGARPRGWPCEGKVDPVYVSGAEATGGKVLLFQPGEVGGVGAEMAASRRHPETVFRAALQLSEGVHEYDVPIDSTIESAYFFVSLQCLQITSIARPSGEELRVEAPDVEAHNFAAVRLFTVQRPAPGAWRVRVEGQGQFSLIVTARTELKLSDVRFMDEGVPVKGAPKPGKPMVLEASMTGAARGIAFQLVSSNAGTIQVLDLDVEKEAETRRTYAGAIVPPETAFRVAMTGIDDKGFRFQRVQKELVNAIR
ncbi:MAG TPA: hypothetical protein VJ813_15555 [Vicinamibacterales bacterium]|nr:hypothetical protein [Vicinamibacterales bacterium]